MQVFQPAKTKLEAVNRISELTSAGPQGLGPGSKERKSVLTNLAIGLGIPFSHELSKQALASLLADNLGRIWLPEYESRGQTITLQGLNLLLEAASFGVESDGPKSTISISQAFDAELRSMAEVITANTPRKMDGRKCVQEMRDNGVSGWRQTEWQGRYFEVTVGEALKHQLGGGGIKYANTTFDYSRNFIWDLKAHSSESSSGSQNWICILNDSNAVDLAVNEAGLGFIILSGHPTFDRDFTKWHKQFRGSNGAEPRRTLKSEFTPERIDIFFVADGRQLAAALARGELTLQSQGKNSNGKPRPPKYHMNLKKTLGGNLQVYSHVF